MEQIIVIPVSCIYPKSVDFLSSLVVLRRPGDGLIVRMGPRKAVIPVKNLQHSGQYMVVKVVGSKIVIMSEQFLGWLAIGSENTFKPKFHHILYL